MKKIQTRRVSEYEFETVYLEIKDMLEKMNIKFTKGMKVALKPNLVLKKSAHSCATTNPLIVKVLGRILKESKAIAYLIESPGGPFTKSRLKAIYEETGMTKVCIEEDIIQNTQIDSYVKSNPNGKIVKSVEIIKRLTQMDYIINLPKLKTHGQMVYTGAVKNMFGIVPGILKAEYHFKTPDYNRFANSIIDIFLAVKPNLNIMDAIYAMEGNGPTAGDKRRLSFIMVSEDAFLMDYICTKIIGLDYMEVPMLMQAVNRNLLCEHSIEEYEDIVFEYKVDDFKIPSRNNPKLLDFSDKSVLGYFMPWLKPKPVVDHSKCVLCGECITSCPTKAMKVKKGKVKINLDLCIRCYCCQELCTKEAIRIKQGNIIKAYLKLRNILLK